MRNLFALVGLLVVVFLGLGWYLNWYRLDWSSGSDGRTKVGLDLDTNKVSGDLKSGAHRAGEFIDTLKTKPASEKSARQDEDPGFMGPPVPQNWPTSVPAIPPAGRPSNTTRR